MSLIGEERKDYILQQLNLEGKVKTYDLVEKLKVSSEMIRRYLEELEEDNKLKRVYGGAIKINVAREEPIYFKREVLFSEEKRRIGRAAASLVEDNDVVFIDDGTTTLQIIDYLLNKKNITVLTISVAGLYMLIDYNNRGLFNGEIYFIGGKIDSSQSRSSGTFAEKMVESFYADKAYISIDGMMVDKGITGFDVQRGQLARKMIERSKQTIVVTDQSKFGQMQFFKIADLKEIDLIISDISAPKEWIAPLHDKHVTWIEAK
ncbi:DeoR/GlpR family DNA-binding transcription regulator [Cohnella abietis]|uniref:DeoR family transcriptional regulator n=1 Tax=Cohnella abietis TaxID=2507935 RepID=A0A3T1DCW4_9BACL|nr:DeoR/GlpR family DNA-binding transcription regulator [Cohnella abietis]BBI35933.1 DeoR family transcriptional regulator [Cohnella abietis]